MQQKRLREGELTESEVKHVLNKTENNKVPGNDGFKKNFLERFGLNQKPTSLFIFQKILFS